MTFLDGLRIIKNAAEKATIRTNEPAYSFIHAPTFIEKLEEAIKGEEEMECDWAN